MSRDAYDLETASSPDGVFTLVYLEDFAP